MPEMNSEQLIERMSEKMGIARTLPPRAGGASPTRRCPCAFDMSGHDPPGGSPAEHDPSAKVCPGPPHRGRGTGLRKGRHARHEAGRCGTGGGGARRLFGSGRNLAGGGSLTVLATVLADARDEGEAERAVTTTESSLVVLDRELAAAGVHPALRATECRASNEDQLREPAELEGARRLRSLLADLDSAEAAALLRERIEASASNSDLLSSL